MTNNFTLYAKWATGSSANPSGYKMFTSISEMSYWVSNQPANTVETAYKVGLKEINLDVESNWGNLGLAIKNRSQYLDLNIQNCTATAIPDGYYEREVRGTVINYTYYGAFLGLNNLVVITLPKGVKTIGKYAFYKCSNLKSVFIPEGLTGIHEEAFRDCIILSVINFPEGLTNIDSYSFRNCNKLTSFIPPKSLKSLGQGAFQLCGLTTLTIPATLTSLSDHAFANNSRLISVVIEEGIEVVETSMFSGCWTLESATLPKSFKSISQDMFRDCKAIKTLEIPANVTSIGASAFYNAFTSGTLIMRPSTPPVMGWLPFEYSSLATIKVPSESVNAYKAASGWSSYASKIVANE